MRTIKRILVFLLILFVLIQIYRSPKNLSGDTTHDISKSYVVPADVHTILSKACYDCHSNKTRYPWYAGVQPVGIWLARHIKDGKSEVNFNEFSSYRVAKQYRKMEECIEQVKKERMPLSSYTIIHTDSKLTDTERATLLSWFESIRDTLRARYPADSLIVKRKTG
jgi:uncharacterized membrane protein